MAPAEPAPFPPIHARSPAAPFVFQVLSSFAQLREIAPELARSAPGQDIFCTIGWFENLLANGMATDAVPWLLLGRNAAGQQCLLPLLAGAGLNSLSNYYSSLYGPVTRTPEHLAEFLDQACGEISRARPRWTIIKLQPLARDGTLATTAAAALARAGCWTDTFRCFGNWYLEVAGRSFEEYYAGLPSDLRHNVERGRARLTRAGEWSIRMVSTPGEDLEIALREYARTYASSWKEPEPFPTFIPGLCRMAAGHGWLRLGLISLQGKAIAAQIWLVKDDTASIYKLAYDADFHRFSPGSILTAHMMAHCIDVDRVRVVDYLTGDDAYKKDWMSHRRERVGLIAFNPATIAGLAAGMVHFARKQLKRLRGAGAAR
jgi:hypothetical protein